MTTPSTPGSTGVGQMGPNDWTSDFNKISFLVKQMVGLLDTMKLVQVTAVTGGGGAIAAAGTVSVQPLVSQVDGNNNLIPPAVVNNVPWWRLQGGNNAVICDPVVGDIGYVVVSDRDMSSALRSKAQAAPGSGRRYNIADSIYVGGIANGAPTQFVAFTNGGIQIQDVNGNVVLLSSNGIIMTPAGGILKVNGQIQATGQVTANFGGASVTLAGHTHKQGNDSHGDTEVPTNAPTSGT